MRDTHCVKISSPYSIRGLRYGVTTDWLKNNRRRIEDQQNQYPPVGNGEANTKYIICIYYLKKVIRKNYVFNAALKSDSSVITLILYG